MEPDTVAQPPKIALLVLGCPQVPVQTSIALYLVSRLKKARHNPGCSGNKAANTLMVVADPDRHYLGEVMDLDRAVAQITEKKRDFDRCFVFIHNDAGIATRRRWVQYRKRNCMSLCMVSTRRISCSKSPFPARRSRQKPCTTPCR